ncbi:hypothetical protein BKA62DRAFT_775956 [Auriculariales sp. MPI-PUGE-AT-0066]|nr:hypothetical protein BKA62DRAFT_775956 [Auriculariales sp. MPI-PUGE-AT-0066]
MPRAPYPPAIDRQHLRRTRRNQGQLLNDPNANLGLPLLTVSEAQHSDNTILTHPAPTNFGEEFLMLGENSIVSSLFPWMFMRYRPVDTPPSLSNHGTMTAIDAPVIEAALGVHSQPLTVAQVPSTTALSPLLETPSAADMLYGAGSSIDFDSQHRFGLLPKTGTLQVPYSSTNATDFSSQYSFGVPTKFTAPEYPSHAPSRAEPTVDGLFATVFAFIFLSPGRTNAFLGCVSANVPDRIAFNLIFLAWLQEEGSLIEEEKLSAHSVWLALNPTAENFYAAQRGYTADINFRHMLTVPSSSSKHDLKNRLLGSSRYLTLSQDPHISSAMLYEPQHSQLYCSTPTPVFTFVVTPPVSPMSLPVNLHPPVHQVSLVAPAEQPWTEEKSLFGPQRSKKEKASPEVHWPEPRLTAVDFFNACSALQPYLMLDQGAATPRLRILRWSVLRLLFKEWHLVRPRPGQFTMITLPDGGRFNIPSDRNIISELLTLCKVRSINNSNSAYNKQEEAFKNRTLSEYLKGMYLPVDFPPAMQS